MNIIHARPRLTDRYRDGWANLDNWGDHLHFKVLGSRVTYVATEFDEGNTTVNRVIGSKHVDQDLQVNALRNYFGGSSCRHEYDCCGCESRHASVRKIRPGVFSVRVSTTFNY